MNYLHMYYLPVCYLPMSYLPMYYLHVCYLPMSYLLYEISLWVISLWVISLWDISLCIISLWVISLCFKGSCPPSETLCHQIFYYQLYTLAALPLWNKLSALGPFILVPSKPIRLIVSMSIPCHISESVIYYVFVYYYCLLCNQYAGKIGLVVQILAFPAMKPIVSHTAFITDVNCNELAIASGESSCISDLLMT